MDAQAGGIVLEAVALGHQLPEDLRPFPRPGMGHRHPDHVLPLGVPRMRHQQPDVPVLDGCLGAEVVLEGPVDEVDRAGGRFAEQAAAQQQMAENRRCVALPGRGGYGRQRLADDPLRPLPVEFRTAVADQPVGEPLEELDLRLLAQLDARGGAHVAFPVAAGEQHP